MVSMRYYYPICGEMELKYDEQYKKVYIKNCIKLLEPINGISRNNI